MIITFKLAEQVGTDISSRWRAARVRTDLLSEVAKGRVVTLDFERVRTISDSFMDELFGVLVQRKGKEWFRSWVKVVSLDHTDRLSLAQAVVNRTETTRRTESHAP